MSLCPYIYTVVHVDHDILQADLDYKTVKQVTFQVPQRQMQESRGSCCPNRDCYYLLLNHTHHYTDNDKNLETIIDNKLTLDERINEKVNKANLS